VSAARKSLKKSRGQESEPGAQNGRIENRFKCPARR
jgi:hypothetical protein